MVGSIETQALETSAALLKTISRGDIDRVGCYYAQDTVFMPLLSGDLRRGRGGAVWGQMDLVGACARAEIDEAETASVVLSDKIVAQGCHCVFGLKNGRILPSRFSTVYQRQPDGTLKILNQHFSILPKSEEGLAHAKIMSPLVSDARYMEILKNKQVPVAATEEMQRVHDSLDHTWFDAVASGQAENVVALYRPDAVLLPTVSNELCRTQDQRLGYFTGFTSHNPMGEVYARVARRYDDVVVDSGLYAFRMKEGPVILARYDYTKNGGGLHIAMHHSSQNPSGQIDVSVPRAEGRTRPLAARTASGSSFTLVQK